MHPVRRARGQDGIRPMLVNGAAAGPESAGEPDRIPRKTPQQPGASSLRIRRRTNDRPGRHLAAQLAVDGLERKPRRRQHDHLPVMAGQVPRQAEHAKRATRGRGRKVVRHEKKFRHGLALEGRECIARGANPWRQVTRPGRALEGRQRRHRDPVHCRPSRAKTPDKRPLPGVGTPGYELPPRRGYTWAARPAGAIPSACQAGYPQCARRPCRPTIPERALPGAARLTGAGPRG